MKLRPLPEIDLARIAPKPTASKWSMLETFKLGGGAWSYEPARSQVFNIFNPSNPMGLRVEKPKLEDIEHAIRKSCKIDIQEASCIEVTKLLWDWAETNAGLAAERPQGSMAIGTLASVRFWGNFVFLNNGRPTFLFLDHRRRNALSQIGLRFAFSIMHQQLRLSDPDFFDASLLILQFPHPKNGERTIRENWDHDFQLFSLDELQEMVSETYQIWAQINAERSEKRPRAASEGWWG